MIKFVFLLLLSANVMATDLPGRLFYTPQQRMGQNLNSKVAKALYVGATVYQGYVMRSDGVNTLWINGQARQVGDAVDMQQLKLPATPHLKPGQAYYGQRHRIVENYTLSTEAPVAEVPQWMAPGLVDNNAP